MSDSVAKFKAAVEADASLSEKSAKSREIAAQIMQKYDRNQDGEFNLGEVVDIIEDLQSEKKQKKRAVLVASGLSVVIVALLAVNAALTAAVVQAPHPAPPRRRRQLRARAAHRRRAESPAHLLRRPRHTFPSPLSPQLAKDVKFVAPADDTAGSARRSRGARQPITRAWCCMSRPAATRYRV